MTRLSLEMHTHLKIVKLELTRLKIWVRIFQDLFSVKDVIQGCFNYVLKVFYMCSKDVHRLPL